MEGDPRSSGSSDGSNTSGEETFPDVEHLTSEKGRQVKTSWVGNRFDKKPFASMRRVSPTAEPVSTLSSPCHLRL